MKGRCIGVPLMIARHKKSNNSIKSLPESMLFKLETPQCICLKGSLTVEASVILPLLACFFSFLLFFFRILQVQLTVQEALEDTGRVLAVISECELSESEERTKIPEYPALAKAFLTAKLAGEENIKRYVAGGALGVTLLTSEWDRDDLLLEVNYAMKFPVNLLGKRYFWMTQQACFRKWTGWHTISPADAEQMTIYVTKNGEAHHRRISCPYLSLSIRTVKISELERLRNNSGERYRLCESCGGGGEKTELAYITNYGTRYHMKLSCSGLKRTIYQITFSEIGGRHACPKCWK